MSAKAKYYIEYFIAGGWHRSDGHSTQRGAIEHGRWYGHSQPALEARIIHRGRIIARWKDGKRVPTPQTGPETR